MKKSQIVFLARRYTPHIGGVETHVSEISSRLKKEFDVTVITEQDQQLEPWKATIDGVRILRIPLPDQKTSKLAIWSWIVSNLGVLLTADIIHIHDVFFWILPVLPLLWIARRRVFVTFHGYEGNGPTFKQKLSHQLAAWLSAGNVCIGGFHEKWYGVKPNVISFGAVSIFPAGHLIKRNKRIKRLIFVGRLSDDVGITAYLSALKVLSAREEMSLDIFGDGPQLQTAKKYVSKHRLPVVFHGFVPHHEIKFTEYDAAFVSRYLAVLECLQAGIPILAHYNSQIKFDYLSLSPFNDWIIKAPDAQSIAVGWSAIQSRVWTQKINQGKAWANVQTWEKLVDAYKSLWER